ncbi:MAG: hypothetical protein HY042_08165, partial [Spirochaetia bacterium]|nr:hypothetical protein [Spirochaetia bacterium]
MGLLKRALGFKEPVSQEKPAAALRDEHADQAVETKPAAPTRHATGTDVTSEPVPLRLNESNIDLSEDRFHEPVDQPKPQMREEPDELPSFESIDEPLSEPYNAPHEDLETSVPHSIHPKDALESAAIEPAPKFDESAFAPEDSASDVMGAHSEELPASSGTDLEDALPAFPDWENEALAEAEHSFDAAAAPAPATQDFLFDSDSDHHTLPAEAHIGSQKKIDNYMALFDISKDLSRIHDLSALWDAAVFGVVGQI